LTDFLEPLKNALENFEFRDLVDIIIVAFILYMLIRLFTKTRAIRMVIGLGIILIFARIFDLLNLSAVSWLLSWVLQASTVLLVVLFQPEIRRALEKLGQGSFFSRVREPAKDAARLIDEFSRAILNMAKHKVGAILVFERKTGLSEVLESGTMLDADVSSELIENVFYPNTPLHDGAMVVRDGRITAAGCFLPLSENKQIASELGTRHRAALGVSEISDAYVIVVSEERGTITFVFDGKLKRNIDSKELRKILTEFFMPENGASRKKDVDLSAETKEIRIAQIAEANKRDGEGDGQ
jgi:diadenylate cyclase